MEVCNKFVFFLLRLFKSNFFNIKTLCHFKVILKYFTRTPPFPLLFWDGPLPPRKPFFSHAPPLSLVKNERSLTKSEHYFRVGVVNNFTRSLALNCDENGSVFKLNLIDFPAYNLRAHRSAKTRLYLGVKTCQNHE